MADQVVVQRAGTVAVEVPLDSIMPRAARAPQSIDGDNDTSDFTDGKLVVVGRGEVLMGNPTQFDRAG